MGKARRCHDTPVVEHGGTWGGFTGLLLLLPERDIGFVILTNLDRPAALPTIREMRNHILAVLLE
jgi:hypothetical protein